MAKSSKDLSSYSSEELEKKKKPLSVIMIISEVLFATYLAYFLFKLVADSAETTHFPF